MNIGGNIGRFKGRAFSPYSRKARERRAAALVNTSLALRENGTKAGGIALREDGGNELRE